MEIKYIWTFLSFLFGGFAASWFFNDLYFHKIKETVSLKFSAPVLFDLLVSSLPKVGSDEKKLREELERDQIITETVSKLVPKTAEYLKNFKLKFLKEFPDYGHAPSFEYMVTKSTCDWKKRRL